LRHSVPVLMQKKREKKKKTYLGGSFARPFGQATTAGGKIESIQGNELSSTTIKKRKKSWGGHHQEGIALRAETYEG